MFKTLRQSICKHHYTYVRDSEEKVRSGIYKDEFPRVEAECGKCEKYIKVAHSDWSYIKSKQGKVNDLKQHNQDWADF